MNKARFCFSCALSVLLLAVACKSGTIEVESFPVPVASLAPGTYVGARSVYLYHPSPTASIRYTVNGAEPSVSTGLSYSGTAIAIEESSTVRAIAWEGDKTSRVVRLDYVIDAISKPRFSPLPGQYGATQTLSLSAEEGASIYYTLDGSNPTAASGTAYSSANRIDVSADLVVKAIAVKGDKTSAVATGSYAIRLDSTKVPRALWGEWLRFDPVNSVAQSWFFAESTLKVGAESEVAISSVIGGLGVTVGSKSIRRESENVLAVEDGGSVYKLVRSRGESTYKATIALPSSASARAFLPTNPGGFGVVISSAKFPSNPITVVPDPSTGEIDFPAIPEVPVSVQPILPADQTPVGDPVTVIPGEPGKDDGTPGDAGIVSVSENAYSFKVSVASGPNYLYADNKQYDLELQISNSGTESSPSVEAAISTDAGLVSVIQYQAGQTGTNPKVNVGTIPAGGSKTVKIKASCSKIAEVFEDKLLHLEMRDADGNVWKDRATLRFYRQKVAFNVASLTKAVNGVLITPDKKSTSFFTEYDIISGVYAKTVEIPFFNDFVVGFSGAQLDSETPYSLGLNRAPATKAEMQAFSNPLAFEGATSEVKDGDQEDLAFPVAADDKLTAMLYAGDYDYFILDTGKTATPRFSIPGSDLAASTPFDIFLSSSTANAIIYYTTDGSTPTASSSVYNASQGIAIAGTTTVKAIAVAGGFTDSAIAEERYSFPTNVVVDTYETLLIVDDFTKVDFANQYEKVLAVRVVSDGNYRITMSDASDGDGADTADLRLSLCKGPDFGASTPIAGATGMDSLYSSPKDIALTSGLHFLKLYSKGGAVSGSCRVKIVKL